MKTGITAAVGPYLLGLILCFHNAHCLFLADFTFETQYMAVSVLPGLFMHTQRKVVNGINQASPRQWQL